MTAVLQNTLIFNKILRVCLNVFWQVTLYILDHVKDFKITLKSCFFYNIRLDFKVWSVLYIVKKNLHDFKQRYTVWHMCHNWLYLQNILQNYVVEVKLNVKLWLKLRFFSLRYRWVTIADFSYFVSAPWFSYSKRILNYLSFQSFDFEPDEGYSRNVSCTLN